MSLITAFQFKRAKRKWSLDELYSLVQYIRRPRGTLTSHDFSCFKMTKISEQVFFSAFHNLFAPRLIHNENC